MSRLLFCSLLLLLAPAPLLGQGKSAIVVPTFDDAYSATVRRLEAGETAVDYRRFRESFIESEQFLLAAGKTREFGELTKQMYAQMKGKRYEEVIRSTQAMLSLNYTSLLAHKILRQTYQIVGDTANAAKYKRIQFGLLNSITRNGNGQSCATAWPVTQLDEEYFILQVLGVELLAQHTDHDGGLCDRMEVRTETGEKRTYYFETSKIFEGYRRAGLR